MSDIIAIDFGTSNSYFALYNNKQGTVGQIHLNNAATTRNGIDSAVLYYTVDGTDIIEIEDAFSRYHGSSLKKIQRLNMKLVTSFKPDIEFSEEARKAAVDFLKNIREKFHEKGTLQTIEGKKVYFGIPCNTTAGYRAALRKIAKEAGWGNDVHMLEEPYGALFYDLDPNDPMAFTQKNTLVIDFGGGTCDFAVIQDGNIKKSWGDTFLGGRLFDDLFYQWSLKIEEEDEGDFKTQEQYEKLFHTGRSTKEKFSLKQPNVYIYDSTPMTKEEFERRCKNYKPSKMLQNVFATQGESARKNSKFRPDQTNDLLQWFEDALLEGFRQHGIDKNSINRIILAGGSSCWYFVRDICKKHWRNITPNTPQNVYAAIAEGMAKYASIRNIGTPPTLNYSELVEKLLNIYQQQEIPKEVIENIGCRIFDQYIRGYLYDFRDNGGTLKSVEENARKSLNDNWNAICEQIEKAISDHSDISQTLIKETQSWLAQHGMTNRHIQQLDLAISIDLDKEFVNNFNIGVGNAFTPIIVTALIAGFSAAIIVSAGLLAPVVGILAYLLTTGLGYTIVQNIPLNTNTSSSLMNDEAIQRTRGEIITAFSTKITEQYKESLEKNKDPIRKELEKFVNGIGNQYQKLLDLERT